MNTKYKEKGLNSSKKQFGFKNEFPKGYKNSL